MKIGILTYHYAYNYGAVLQAYALQTFLKGKGHEVEIINYHNKTVDLYYSLFGYKAIPKRNPRKFIEHMRIAFYRKPILSRFKKNTLELLNISRRIITKDDLYLKGYDLIIVGSDQLWNKKITGGNDAFYWGEFVYYTHKPAITYAICMNAENVTTNEFAYIKSHLANFSKISVRENDLADYLRKDFGIDPEVSLDPTLMIDGTVWRNILKNKEKEIAEPYICVYPILEREKVIDYAKRFAKGYGMKLVVLYPIAECKPGQDYYVAQTPVDFVNTIAHAEYIVTSSFHGLAFSIIFKKEVLVIGDSGKNTRMKSLLANLGMESRFLDKVDRYSFSKIDYDLVESKLFELRDKSQKYLIDNTNIK